MLSWTSIFFSSFFIALSGALMPGPLLLATVAEASQTGFWAGPLLVAGHGILELGMLFLLLFGLSPFFQYRAVLVLISLLGGMVLLWMSVQMFRSLPRLSLSIHATEARRARLIFTGALVSVSNPYWVLWWVTIGLGCIVTSQQLGVGGLVAFFIGHILADFFWYSAISYGTAKGKRFLSEKLYRGFVGILAGFLVFFAGYFFWSGLQRLGL